MNECIDHLAFLSLKCPDCGLDVDGHGNTEDQFEFCCFPNCGCDGARLCMASEANTNAQKLNVEGMWSGNSKEQRAALLGLVGLVRDEKGE